MALFSERLNYSPARKALQYECMSKELRMAVYNVIFEWLNDYNSDERSLHVCRSLWSELWHLPLDKFPEPDPLAMIAMNGPRYSPVFFEQMKEYLLKGQWFMPYDLVEFIAKQYQIIDKDLIESNNYEQVADVDDDLLLSDFIEDINEALAREMSAYRLVGACVTPITNDSEITTLEQNLSAPNCFSGVRMHMGKALEYYSLRPQPDYANTIKESISAVESAMKVVIGSEKDTLAGALKKLGKRKQVHPALIDGWAKLYGFTSDAGGVRHASNTEEVAIDAALAKYMLVTCSAFSNYLIELGPLDERA